MDLSKHLKNIDLEIGLVEGSVGDPLGVFKNDLFYQSEQGESVHISRLSDREVQKVLGDLKSMRREILIRMINESDIN